MRRLPPKFVSEFIELVTESSAGWQNDHRVLEFVRARIMPPETLAFSDLVVRQVISDAASCIDMSGDGWSTDRCVIAELWLLLGPRAPHPEPTKDENGFDQCPQCSRVFHPIGCACPGAVFGETPSG